MLRPACAYGQSDQSLCQSLEYSLNVKLLSEHNFEFLSLKGCCTGLSESTLVEMPHCWKSHVMAHFGFLQQAFFNGMLYFSKRLRHIVRPTYVSMPHYCPASQE